MGWYQEKQAGDIVAQLKKGIALQTTVVRDGREAMIEARELVAGDIIVLEEGKTIPADARILANYDDKGGKQAAEILEKRNQSKGSSSTAAEDDEEHDEDEVDKGPSVLSVDQSAITGESLAVEKYIDEIAFYTCGVKRGKVYAMVTCPAKQSFVGRTANLVLSTPSSPYLFQPQLRSTCVCSHRRERQRTFPNCARWYRHGAFNHGYLLHIRSLDWWVFPVCRLQALLVLSMFLTSLFVSSGIGIAEPKENNLLVYALIFLVRTHPTVTS